MPDRRKEFRPSSRDRRRNERGDVRVTLWISGPDGDTDEPLAVDNVSAGGLAFRSREAWPEETAICVHVNVDEPQTLAGRILWCSERKPRFRLPWQDGSKRVYEIGVAFTEEDVERRREIVEKIFQSDVYQRGLVA